MYHHSTGICQNCGSTGTHTCVIDFKNKYLKFDEGLLNIQVLFDIGFKWNKAFLDSIPHAKNQEEDIYVRKKSYSLQNCFNGYFQKEDVEYKCD